MNKLNCLMVILLVFAGITPGCTQSDSSAGRTKHSQNDLIKLISLSDAEKILGEPAQLTDSSVTSKADAVVYEGAYKATGKDTTLKIRALYFVIEQYNNSSPAEKRYSFIKTANADHEGIRVLKDVGDEAYFHSDGENFCFIMARKGGLLLTLKVNKLSSKTSIDQFHSIARRIINSSLITDH
jgi:hypothetical protein